MNIVAMISGIVMIALGSLILVVLKKTLATKKWPTVEGTITSSKLESDWGDFKYKYYVNGKHYTSNKIEYSIVKYPALANQFTNVYKLLDISPDNKVTVYYDINNPQRSLLLPGIARHSDKVVITIGILMAFCAGITFMVIAFLV